jgi:TrmH family RNA methyltransferase
MTAGPRLVFVQPRNPDNLASVARAMKTFGLVDWVAVSNAHHLEVLRDVLRRHRAPSEDSAQVDTLRRADTLAEAVADCSWVVGTSMNSFDGRPRFTARELAAVSAERRDTTWALVFGAECNGLRNADVRQCHAVSFIPSEGEQPSLNLAQAVVVYAYELAASRSDGRNPKEEEGGNPDAVRPVGAGARATLAGDASLRSLGQALRGSLVAAGHLPPRREGRRLIAELMSSLVRGRLTVEEAAAWRSMWDRRGRG